MAFQFAFEINWLLAALKHSKENQTRNKVWAIYVGQNCCVKVKVFWEDQNKIEKKQTYS